MVQKSVLECLEEASRCTETAATVVSEKEVLRHLRRAAVWLEIAKYRASREGVDAWQSPSVGNA
jgi:hypothetical protein